MTKTRTFCRTALVGVIMILLGHVVVQIYSAAPASAVPGLIRVVGQLSTSEFQPNKTVYAYCPPGKRILGGGAWVNDGGHGRVMLTGLIPTRNADGKDWFEVIASAPAGFSTPWSVRAYAICSYPLPGLGMYFSSSGNLSPAPFQHAERACPAGKRAISAGGRVNPITGDVGLQLVRVSGPLDISRTTARAGASGYAGPWQVVSWVMCADPIPGAGTAGVVVNAAGGSAECPTGTRVHGAGGGGSITDSGPVFLHRVYPDLNLRGVQTVMTAAPVAGMVVHILCA